MINLRYLSNLAAAGMLAVLLAPPVLAEDDVEESTPDDPCVSTDPNVSDHTKWAITAVELFGSGQYAEAVATVDACFRLWGPAGGQQQKALYDEGATCPATGEVSERTRESINANGLLNDVSMALWAKARSLHELDQTELAEQAYARCIYMACGRAWDPQGWFWSPAEDCAEHARELLD